MKKNEKNIVYVVEIDDCYEYETHLTVKLFSTRRKALRFFCEKLNEFYEDGIQYDTVENNDSNFYAYDEGWWARDHYSVKLYEEEVQ